MGMRLVICLHPFTLNILVTPLDTEGSNERVRGGWEGRSGKETGVERGAERVGNRRRRRSRTEGRS